MHPAADELCNDIDDDCDDDIDEDAVDAPTWHGDADGDGFGGSTFALVSCEQPPGYVAIDDDCDDLAAETWPGAPELCDEADNDCDTDIDEGVILLFYGDGDGDGFGDVDAPVEACAAGPGLAEVGGDCDDVDPAINPAAPELCDGLDNDCDTDIDEGVTLTVYGDIDGDGWGDAPEQVCALGPDMSFQDGDCDDENAAVYPGALELCDGLDNDCDTDIDEDPVDTATFYADNDGDGFGDLLGGWTEACEAPSGYAADGTDCDDGAPDTFPGAPELCVDGVDTDCDGLADEDDPDACPPWTGWSSSPLALADAADHTILGSSGAGQLARAVANAGDVDGDGLDDLLIGAWGEAEGRAYLFLGASLASPADLLSSDADHVFVGEAPGDLAGASVAGVGDVDGDGLGDLLIGAPTAGGVGRAYLFYGASLASQELPLADADVIFVGQDADDRAGWSVEGIGDLDGDGLDDLVIGAYGDDEGADRAGAACLFLGAGLSAVAQVSLADADLCMLGEAAGDDAGWSVVGLGDVDGDGLPDLAVSAPENDAAGDEAGAVYVVLGATLAAGGDLPLSAADFVLLGEAAGDQAGYALSAAGDVDGDGLDDLLVGTVTSHLGGSYSGAAYLVLGSGLGPDVSASLATADHVLVGAVTYERAGRAVASAGDVDGDGLADLLIGAPYHNSADTPGGVSYLVLAPTALSAPVVDLADADHRLLGEQTSDLAGAALASADVDGDGLSDLLVGALGSDEAVGHNTGKAYLVPASSLSTDVDVPLADAHVSVLGLVGREALGGSLALLDVDGDGLDDLLVGSGLHSAGGVNTGRACLHLGADLAGQAEWMDDDAAICLYGAEEGGRAGSAVASAGDVDGDGLDDLLIGAWLEDAGGTDRGRVYLVLAASLGSGPSFQLADADHIFEGVADSDRAGYSVAGAGDVDGDGLDDLLIGAYYADGTGVSAGAAYVVLASGLGATQVVSLADADHTLDGEAAYDYAGLSVAGVGDVDGDGLDDVLVGGYGNDVAGSAAGAAYLVPGASLVAGNLWLGDASYRLRGAATLDYAGARVAGAGDVDGDGLDDLLVGAYYADGGGDASGAVYLVLGASLDADPEISLADADLVIDGEGEGDLLGQALGAGGDVDGDGLDDLLVCAPGWERASGVNTGRAYLVLASGLTLPGVLSAADADLALEGRSGTHASRGCGAAAVGDIDGDGLPDLVFGDSGDDLNGINAGVVFVVSSP